VAKILSKMSLLLVGSATTGATEEKCHRHRKTTKSLCAIGFPKGDGSFRFGSGARIWGDLISVIGRWWSVLQRPKGGALPIASCCPRCHYKVVFG